DTTILLVEQNLSVARRLASDAVVLDQGTVVFDDTIDALFADADLTERYLGVAGGHADEPAGGSAAGSAGTAPTTGGSHP
ncbi:MAG TPA: hypothetical protein VMM13_16830, partial [Euzebya sp.]|nr:hypothetical protein [Euzebya sp.]